MARPPGKPFTPDRPDDCANYSSCRGLALLDLFILLASIALYVLMLSSFLSRQLCSPPNGAALTHAIGRT